MSRESAVARPSAISIPGDRKRDDDAVAARCRRTGLML
jgi:hypothetical protein